MRINTTYRCWGCKAEKTTVEVDEPYYDDTHIEKEVWNLCPNCTEEVMSGKEKAEMV